MKEHHPPPPRQINPAIPARLSALIMRLLAKEPANRPASAGEVERELARVEGSLRRRRWVRVAAASAAALVVLLAALLAFWRRDLAVTQMKITIDSQTRTLVRDGREPDDRRGPVVVPPGKSFKLEGQLSKPAYWYLVWFDTRGRAVVEAWSSGRQTDVEYPRGNRRQLVDAADPPGTHLLLLLAGSEPPKTGTALLADRLKEIGKPPPMNIRAGGRVVEADNELPSEYLRRIDASLPHGFQRMYPLFFTTTEIKP